MKSCQENIKIPVRIGYHHDTMHLFLAIFVPKKVAIRGSTYT